MAPEPASDGPEKADGLDQKARRVYKGARYASVGIEFGVSVVIGYLIGRWLEGKFGWQPWGTVGGVVIGFAAGLKSLYEAGQRAMRESEDQERP